MSVINKMLRDLDQRQSQAGAADAATVSVRQSGVASVPLQPVRGRRVVRWGWWLMLVLVAVMAAAGWWQWQQMGPLSTPRPPPSPAAVLVPPEAAPTSAAPVVAQPPVQEAVIEAPFPANPLPDVTVASGLRMESTLSLHSSRVAEVASAVPPKAAAAPAAPKAEPSVPAAAMVEPPKKSSAVMATPSPATTAVPAAPIADAVGQAQRQQQAARETLAQAQALWNGGAHDNAIALLQDAVAAAERAAQTNASGANSQTLVSMLRELGRMELAEGRASAVWDLLTRMEPLMVNQPDLWALRANAAQRLGRHQDSVQAYTMALQSRPGEQRWLLGAAVSLAALGQTTAAAEMADKARAVGPVSKEVQTYLRQQGVPLADR